MSSLGPSNDFLNLFGIRFWINSSLNGSIPKLDRSINVDLGVR